MWELGPQHSSTSNNIWCAAYSILFLHNYDPFRQYRTMNHKIMLNAASKISRCLLLSVVFVSRYQPPTPLFSSSYQKPHQNIRKWVTQHLLSPALCCPLPSVELPAADTHLSTMLLPLELPRNATGGNCAWMHTYPHPQMLGTEGQCVTLITPVCVSSLIYEMCESETLGVKQHFLRFILLAKVSFCGQQLSLNKPF